MKIVSTQTMRELERRTLEAQKAKPGALMDRAGHAVATAVRRLADASGFPHAFVHLIAGRGNNGGDAFVAARYLKDLGLDREVWIAGGANQLTGDAAAAYTKAKNAKIRIEELPTLEDWQHVIRLPLAAEILVDGVFGTGLDGPARGPAAGAIQYIRSRTDDSLVLSIDIPSGLDADSGIAHGDAVMADLTVTMGLPKPGLIADGALDYVGTVDVAEIDLDPEAVAEAECDAREMIQLRDLASLLPRRRRTAHKGDFGHVLLIGGSRGYAGAIALAARAALRSGAGLVTAVVPESIQSTVAGACIEAMTIGAPEVEGRLDSTAIELALRLCSGASAVLLGPGLGRSDEVRKLVLDAVQNVPAPMVVDADALHLLARDISLCRHARAARVLTPHPGEMGRLLGSDAASVQTNRLDAALRAARESQQVIVLKGAGTLVVQVGETTHVNANGNPGMATGGTGDVLAGLLAGFLAQGIRPFDAARLAVCLHGRAGDLAAWRGCQAGMTAGDLLDELSNALRDVSVR